MILKMTPISGQVSLAARAVLFVSIPMSNGSCRLTQKVSRIGWILGGQARSRVIHFGAALEMLYTGGRIDAQKVPVLLPKNVHQTGRVNSHRFSVLG